jgi:hypothetical protein
MTLVTCQNKIGLRLLSLEKKFRIFKSDFQQFGTTKIHQDHRKIRLREGNAKCRHLKKFTCNGTLRQVFICLIPRTPYPPPYTLYTCIQYTYSRREEGEGGDLNRKKGKGATVHKAGSTIATFLTESPVSKLL